MTLHITRVADDQKRKPTLDEQVTLFTRMHDLQDRFVKGALDPVATLNLFQKVQEGYVISDSREKKIEENNSLKPLLELVTASIQVSATERFVAKEHFKEDTSDRARIKICSLSMNFQSWFLGKVEESAKSMHLQIHKLLRYSKDNTILAELGNTAETMLVKLYHMLAYQPGGEVGPLLTNKNANIFYIKNVNGILCAVHVYWYPDHGGWYVNARSVECPALWDDGDQVVSRNSVN